MPNYMNPVDLKRYVSSIRSIPMNSPEWEKIRHQVIAVNQAKDGTVVDGTLLTNPQTRYTQYFFYSHADKDYVFDNVPNRKTLKKKGSRS